MQRIIFILFILCSVTNLAHSQHNYGQIKDFELIPFYSEEFNNNTNKWFMSDLYPFYSTIENSRLVLSTQDFPNQILKNIRINIKKDFQIEYSMKQLSGDSTLAAYFLYGYNIENGNAYGFIPTEKNLLLATVKRKNPEIIKKTYVEKSYEEFFNKYTIRKIKSKLYFFINEQLIFTEKSSDFESGQIGWLIPANTTFAIDFFNAVYLKPKKLPKQKEKQ